MKRGLRRLALQEDVITNRSRLRTVQGIARRDRERARSLERRLERLEHSLVAERARHARLLALLVNGGVLSEADVRRLDSGGLAQGPSSSPDA